jgi:hypothetical protein
LKDVVSKSESSARTHQETIGTASVPPSATTAGPGIENPGTQRTDNWQLEPVLTILGIGLFVIYATWRAFQNAHFEVPGTQYISPFYSPYFPHWLHQLGISVKGLETVLPNGSLGWLISPALFILWVPAGFRTTCYFYRRAYYRSFFASPSACAVGPKAGNPVFDALKGTLGRLLGPGKKYTGETALPLLLMNIHRYFFYIAALFILVHIYDTFASFFLPGYAGIRIGVGTLVLVIDLALLSMYTFGCHSWRHILGGQLDCFSSCPMNQVRHHAWQRQSILNANHMQLAWLSMFWVGFADFYISQVAKGAWPDFVFFTATWKGLFG